jgi:hypothetical protein
MEKLEDVVELLVLMMQDSQSRKDAVLKLDKWFSKPGLPTKSVIRADAMEIVHDLVIDLSYYVPDPRMRAQDPCYFGDDRLLKEVKVALQQLSELGVPMPDSYVREGRQ